MRLGKGSKLAFAQPGDLPAVLGRSLEAHGRAGLQSFQPRRHPHPAGSPAAPQPKLTTRQRPRVSPIKDRMKSNLARVLKADPNVV
eukprot:766088-Hanusia_phi.AAC.7